MCPNRFAAFSTSLVGLIIVRRALLLEQGVPPHERQDTVIFTLARLIEWSTDHMQDTASSGVTKPVQAKGEEEVVPALDPIAVEDAKVVQVPGNCALCIGGWDERNRPIVGPRVDRSSRQHRSLDRGKVVELAR